jgi:hypothetical protein
MIYRYQCPECDGVSELIQPMTAPTPDSISCRFCKADAPLILGAPTIGHSGGTPSKTPFDVQVGRYAASRWAAIHERQSSRDAVRVQSKVTGLTTSDFTTFEPLSSTRRRERTDALNEVERRGGH